MDCDQYKMDCDQYKMDSPPKSLLAYPVTCPSNIIIMAVMNCRPTRKAFMLRPAYLENNKMHTYALSII